MAAAAAGLLPEPQKKVKADDNDSDVESLAVRVVLAVLATVVTFVLTGWPVAMMYAALGGFFLPTFAMAKKKRREAVERVEAIATWTESLRDTMAASAGLQEALRTSARVAPAPIRTEVRDLALRLQHQTTASALRHFASDMRHPLADLVVASLVLAASRHGGSLQSVLLMTAKAARDSAAMLRHVEAGRARIYSQARLAGWVSFLMIAFLIVTQRDFVQPFDTFLGQIVLLFVGGAFFGAGVAVYRMSRPTDPHRVFEDIEAWGLDDVATATEEVG